MSSQVLTARRSYLFGNLFPHSLALGFTGRNDGNMSFSSGDTSQTSTSRADFLNAFGADESRLVCARQVHGDTVVCVDSSDTDIPDCDALITGRRRLPLAVFTADCLPVFLYDAQRQVVAIVHAGWRGTRANIAGKTVQAMMKQFGCQPEDIYAGFGPAIRSCCYEVGEEFRDFFKTGVSEKDGKYFFDLAAANKEQLRKREIKEENIFDSRICTSCRNEEYFSYRREGGSCGRSMSVVFLR
ncbi:MAG: peptidoglycan editing factor PgeF [Candidatus Omnitrophica bacterium]|jgi:hypothetical protein|nr:peptidoglycan editing factor PgeF [Candidatus Omnitrophota bacterium]